ncbi:MAG: sigma-54-dependent Fis family transcriptional regulator [Acidobacteria bacterium]|nr:sigma-54-dependent Fis family transcriptional regulator [Acidobacteriota bacterium]
MAASPAILLNGRNTASAAALCTILNATGYKAVSTASLREFSKVLQALDPALIVVDDVDIILACPAATASNVPILLLALDESEARAVRALRCGVADYFRWPEERQSFLERVRQLAPVAAGSDELGRALVGESRAIQEVRRQVRQAALSDCNVLLVGETGTGKELAAGFIHSMSRRASRPFVSMNCAAIPETLLESELFGYEKGAFTGAATAYDGKLQQAHGGTLFLDEVGDMSPVAQAKVLRAFESKPVYRLGGRTPVVSDVRFVAATNADLEVATAEQRFRSDLFFRLSVAHIRLPALRERPDDIPLLVDHFVRECSGKYKRQQEFSRSTMKQLVRHAWPGNVRELKNLVEATFVNSRSRWLSWADLPAHFRRQLPAPLDKPWIDDRERLLSVLAETQWNKSEAANRLNWSRMTLYRKLAKYKVVNGGKL